MAAYAAKGIKVHGYVCDVTNEPAVQALVAQIEKEVGTIDILVNNAGIIRRVPMHEMEAADFRRVIDIDLNAPFIVSKAVLPAMMKKGHGKIINICSMMSELGRETVSAYAAAKGGLKMLTRNICSEYGEYNIQCNGIGPGYIATPQTAPLREKQPDGSRHPFDSFICAKTPAGRWLDPQELTGPAVFLASEASNAVNCCSFSRVSKLKKSTGVKSSPISHTNSGHRYADRLRGSEGFSSTFSVSLQNWLIILTWSPDVTISVFSPPQPVNNILANKHTTIHLFFIPPPAAAAF